MNRPIQHLTICLLAASLACLGNFALPQCAAQNPTDAKEEFFEARIRPILVEHCYECHSGTSSKGGSTLAKQKQKSPE